MPLHSRISGFPNGQVATFSCVPALSIDTVFCANITLDKLINIPINIFFFILSPN